MERLPILAKPNQILLLAAVAALLAPPAAAAWDTSEIAGYVSPECLVDLADAHPEISIVEVTLPKSLIRAVGLGIGENPDLQRLVFGLEWVSAVVIETDDEKIARTAQACIKDVEERLTRKGWERLARVREEGENVNILILNGSETVRGVVVLSFGEDQFVMTNLAGVINLELLSQLSEEMEIPGLDVIPEKK